MSDAQDYVVVYRYRYWDEERREMTTSKGEATLPCIKDGLGIPVVESGRKVPRSCVDDRGRLIVAERQDGPERTAESRKADD
jgi:hypothetical protein